MKRIIILTLFFLPSFAYSEELKLECKLDNYNGINRSYEVNVIKSWVPVSQTHIINVDKTSRWNNRKIDGEVKKNNTKKIHIKYDYKNSTGQWAKYDFLYFKTSKKVAIGLIFPGYQPLGDVWGNCLEIKLVNKKPTENLNSKKDSLENVSDKLVCYRHGLYNGTYIKEAKRRNLNCKSENKNKNKIINSDSISNKTEPAETKCKELGFKKGNENFGNCVLKLMD